MRQNVWDGTTKPTSIQDFAGNTIKVEDKIFYFNRKGSWQTATLAIVEEFIFEDKYGEPFMNWGWGAEYMTFKMRVKPLSNSHGDDLDSPPGSVILSSFETIVKAPD